MLQIGRVYYEYKTALDICERASKGDAARKKQKDEMNLLRTAGFLQKLESGIESCQSISRLQGETYMKCNMYKKFSRNISYVSKHLR